MFRATILLLVAGCSAGKTPPDPLIALEKGLSFMETKVAEINLDGVLGARLVEEQLSSFLIFEPQVFGTNLHRIAGLRDQAGRVGDRGSRFVQTNEPEYSSALGHAMNRSKKLIWYESRNTLLGTRQTPVPCTQSVFNETNSDLCLQELIGRGTGQENPCILSEGCVSKMTEEGQRGYILTHQVLYWQLAQMRGCLKDVPESLRISLCSNVMRDAEEISRAKYPRNHQDLFMEQIGLCGIWGFKDFWKKEWLSAIVSWQEPSGCYAHRAKWHCTDDLKEDSKRVVKRREKITAGGCLSHKTAVAILALTMHVRFQAEEKYNQKGTDFNL